VVYVPVLYPGGMSLCYTRVGDLPPCITRVGDLPPCITRVVCTPCCAIPGWYVPPAVLYPGGVCVPFYTRVGYVSRSIPGFGRMGGVYTSGFGRMGGVYTSRVYENVAVSIHLGSPFGGFNADLMGFIVLPLLARVPEVYPHYLLLSARFCMVCSLSPGL